ncbi:MAG: DNA polymerase III subunit alpha [Candidatus Pacebacteria bacterium]|nr:DNA polymerase III subunit alpha [Candidatus Paceibacterota bacterium]
MAASFVPLHVHSHYSLLRALPKIGDLVKKAKDEGVEALALTDLGNLYGAIEFYKACKDAGIKPIIGLESVMEGGKHILLYAKDRTGYLNLLQIVTKSHLNSPGNPTVTSEMLKEHGEGLITLDPKETDVPMREVYYLEGEDRRAWETLRAIENRGPIDSGNIDDEEDNFAFPTQAEMEEKFGQKALQKTLDIAAQCNLDLGLGTWHFPDIEIPAGATYDQELRRLVEEGIKRRFIQETPEIRTRIEYEYEIITKKGYSSYFLVVADLLAFARENKILTTIRGSVAGSLTTYVLGITNVNPLLYKLPFERFLNPERPSAPDIDMDYADNRRDEVIEYARRKYGADKVAQIGTFGTMLARGVVRDVARALGLPYGLGDAIAKEIPMGSQGFPMTLERAMVENPELAKMYKNDAQVREIIELGKKIEGCARHVGVHAAGVVISPTPLTDYTPLQLDPKGGKLITQYDMYSIDENNAGLLKFDFLGIKNLAILAHSVELVEKTRGITIDIENVPVDDTRTFEMLARGETEGLFQLNGSGMTRFLKELKPSTIHDINAMVALYRPGPMETIPQYIERKHNPAMVSYADPRMRDYLEFSHGVLVYQDDVLLTAITLGGYSWLEADKLRKAMGKKIPEVMEAEREKLIKGFVEYGKLKPQLAERLWKLIEPFAAYGFNKAHAASYGKVAYQTAYMKANYPVEYMSAVLTADAGDVDTVSIMVNECKRMGIPVLAPDINESFGDFTVILGSGSNVADAGAPQGDDPRTERFPSKEIGYPQSASIAPAPIDSIRFGLYSIKNFGSGVADSIIKERQRAGRFVSLSDFLTRVADNGLNKKGLESLIMCGALDSFGERGAMLAHIEQLLQYHRDAAAEHMHDSLFADVAGHSEIKVPVAPPATQDQRLVWEKELLGLYVSGHPLDKFKDKLAKRPLNLAQIKERSYPGTTTVIAGMIEDLRILLTKNGDQMAFIKLADFSGAVEAVVFPKSFVEYKSILRPEACIAIKGRVSNRNGEFSIVTEALKAL